jgi:hypothetical protein
MIAKQRVEVKADPEVKPNLHVGDNLQNIYADGVSGVALGFPLTKIIFHTVLAPGVATTTGIEQRRAVAQLSIPTHVLLELCRNLLANSVASRPQMEDAIDTLKGVLGRTLEGINITAMTPVSAEPTKRRSKSN